MVFICGDLVTRQQADYQLIQHYKIRKKACFSTLSEGFRDAEFIATTICTVQCYNVSKWPVLTKAIAAGFVHTPCTHDTSPSKKKILIEERHFKSASREELQAAEVKN